jgi:glycine hydroxymethyltransferase
MSTGARRPGRRRIAPCKQAPADPGDTLEGRPGQERERPLPMRSNPRESMSHQTYWAGNEIDRASECLKASSTIHMVSSLSVIDLLSDPADCVSGRDALLQSLTHQRRELAESIVLTPVDSLPFSLADREHTAFLQGLYLTDKDRDREARKDALILFGGRERAAQDLAYIHRLLADAFGAAKGSLRLLSGLHAHAATFMSISTIGQKVMLLSEEAGGHFSTHAILHRLGLRTIDLPIDHRRLCIDESATLRLVHSEQPDFIFIDRSEGLRYEDFSFLGSLEGPTTIFDASHYIPQILTDRYPNPLAWGFDLMLFSLHKSFPGPQKAGIVSRQNSEVWAELVAGLSTLVSSSHAEDSYLVGLTLLREEWLETYSGRLLETALELETQLLRRGLDVVSRSEQGYPEWPSTHHVWIRAPDKDTAFIQYERLARAHIHANYRRLPYGLGYGLRLGTTFSSVAGISLVHIEELADVLEITVRYGDNQVLRDRVRELAESARADAIVPPEYWA